MCQKVRAFAVAMLAAAFAACGSSNPVASTSAAIPIAPVVSGLDGRPVSNATMAGTGGQMTVTAPGFLTLDTVEHSRPIQLWPHDSQITLAGTYEFVYGSNESNPLRRLGDSTSAVAVMPGPIVAADKRAMAALQEGTEWVNRLMADAQVNVRYVIGGPGQVRLDIEVQPDDPGFQGESKPGALAYSFLQEEVVTGGKIAILGLEQARLTVLVAHELVHIFGLGHSLHKGLMLATAEVYKYSSFQPLDVAYVRLVRTRQPGTRMVFSEARENDRMAVRASSGRRSVQVTVCQ